VVCLLVARTPMANKLRCKCVIPVVIERLVMFSAQTVSDANI
jgi:hypothetical protein